MPVALPVKVAVQVREAPLPPRLHVVVVGDTPAPLAVRPTVPVGPVAPGDVSVTVTVQVLATPTTTGLEQPTLVVVVWAFTVIEPLPELVACVESPAYEADTLTVPVALPVKLAVQVVALLAPLREHVVDAGVAPAPVAVRLTVPVGAVGPDPVSVTVMVQRLGAPASTGLAQLIDVAVARFGARLKLTFVAFWELETEIPATVCDTKFVADAVALTVALLPGKLTAIVYVPFAAVVAVPVHGD